MFDHEEVLKEPLDVFLVDAGHLNHLVLVVGILGSVLPDVTADTGDGSGVTDITISHHYVAILGVLKDPHCRRQPAGRLLMIFDTLKFYRHNHLPVGEVGFANLQEGVKLDPCTKGVAT